MAITKIKPIKGTLKKALDYIMNPDKTDGKMLVSSYGCSYETADIEFGFTLSQAMQKGNNLAHHMIQSFSPDECADGHVTPELAHEIGKRFADSVTSGKYEYVISTHIDRGHIHNHIIFCAVDFVDHKKYVSNKKSYARLRSISDNLCREYGLSVVVPQQETAKSYYEYQADKSGISWKKKLRSTIDLLIPQSQDFDDLLKRLENAGYEIKHGKYISCRAPEQERFTRLKTLGNRYAEDQLKERVYDFKHPGQNHFSSVSLIIDLQNCLKAKQSAGYEHWAKIHNLKQAAETLNYLTEHHIEQYSDFESHANRLMDNREQLASEIKFLEKQITKMTLIIKYVTVYKQTEMVYREYQNAKNKSQFRSIHERDILLHESALNALRENHIQNPLPEIGTLIDKYSQLQCEKESLYHDYEIAKRRTKECDIVKKNIDSILEIRSEPEQEHDIETR